LLIVAALGSAQSQNHRPQVKRTFDSSGCPPYHARAMANPLLDHASPGDLADRGQTFEIEGEIQDFKRLLEIVEADLAEVPAQLVPAQWRMAPVGIKLDFSWADAKKEFPALTGQVTANIAALCQRCLEPCEIAVETELKMVLVKKSPRLKVAETAFSEFEVWELAEDTIRPLDIVEEALIMALPLSPLHSSRDLCGQLADDVVQEKSGTARPFADLKSQMGK
jgi:uncharacterized metal-binding protein YceD (DUF177 family)